MFKIFELGDWQGVGGSATYRLAKDGAEAIAARENRGLPLDPSGWIPISCEDNGLTDRRAAESWPESLNSSADLPLVTVGANRKSSEFADMVAAAILVPVGPFTSPAQGAFNTAVTGLRFKLAVSPFELVQWRRAWAASQEAADLRKRLSEAESRIEELEAATDGAES